MPPASTSRRVKLAAFFSVFLVLFGLAEFGLYLLPQLGTNILRKGLLYFSPTLSEAEYTNYLAIRDPVLGWPTPKMRGGREHDLTGARVSPAFPDPGGECVSLYGDSFTYGEEVNHEDAWGNRLAQRLGCRVANFGGNAYGTDQALLRFQQNADIPGKVALLGIYAENPMRNVNQNRYYLTGSTILAMKPRFVLEAETLRLVPMPDLNYTQMLAAIQDPAGTFRHEAFLPGSALGPTIWSFPRTVALAHFLNSYQFRNYIRGLPAWIDFWHPDHPSGALAVTAAIAMEFHRLAQSRGMASLVVMFPSGGGHELFRRQGSSPFQPLTNILRARGIQVVDFSEEFARHLGDKPLCPYLTQPGVCVGHYNAVGSRLVAELLAPRVSAALAGRN